MELGGWEERGGMVYIGGRGRPRRGRLSIERLYLKSEAGENDPNPLFREYAKDFDHHSIKKKKGNGNKWRLVAQLLCI